MQLLENKHILITGVLSKYSLAYSIAQYCKMQGAHLAFTYQSERFKDRVSKFAAQFDSDLVLPCDVAKDEEITELFATLAQQWSKLDGLVHAIAFAPRESIEGDFLTGCTREHFQIAHDISAYSFVALANAARGLLEQSEQGALLTLSYLGAEKSLPNYNTMGLAKASLEAAVRYMAECLGPGGVRVNALSAGPVKTVAASGIGQFNSILEHHAMRAPLRRNMLGSDVAKAAVFLLSDLASGVTGETLYVDGGFNTTATPQFD